MDDTNAPLKRRDFLKVAAIGTAGWVAAVSARTGEPEKKPEPKKEEASDFNKAFSGFDWIDQDGKAVNLSALEAAKLKGKYVTLSFGFKDCATFCPETGKRLKAVSGMNPGAVHVIVSVDPETDGTEEGRKAFLKKLMESTGLKEADKIIILFPVKTDDKGKRQFAPENAVAVQGDRLGAIVNRENPKAHTPYIYLFGKAGEKLTRKSGTKPVKDFDDWKKLMPKESEKSK